MGGMCCGVCAGRRGAAVGEWVVVVVSRVRRWVVELCCAVLLIRMVNNTVQHTLMILYAAESHE